jgi:hypothetical protein
MPRGTPQAKASEKRTAARERAEAHKKEEEDREKWCADCPIAKAFGLCGNMCATLGAMDINDFLIHLATARREIMLGLKSLLDEAIRMEEERIDKRQSVGKKSGGKEKLREIAIE